MNNDKAITEKKPEPEVKQEPTKKRPAIIELSPTDLESAVGGLAAGRCPPDESA